MTEEFAFLSRPRRFGKSLLVSTLKELFEGSESLFEGLAIHSQWDWSTTFPVIHINFSGGVYDIASLHVLLQNIIDVNADRLQVEVAETSSPEVNFQNLVAAVHKKYGQKVVILVDEYDKPLLDNLSNPQVKEIRARLAGFYSVIKQQGAMLRFVFLTGVSQFSKTSIFSQLNNLTNITLDAPYGTLCGYTENELENAFSPWLADVDRGKLKTWYNGYKWRDESVYNPYDILLFFKKNKEYEAYWYDSGTPTFLVELLQRRYYHIPELLNLTKTQTELNSFAIEALDLEAVLFQMGYLTIKKVTRDFTRALYTLGFPNQEVRTSFNQLILRDYLSNDYNHDAQRLLKALQRVDFDEVESHLRLSLAALSHDSYRNNTIASYEGYYANIVFALFMSLPISVQQEDTTNKGRIDLTVQLRDTAGINHVYIFEFKVVDGQNESPGMQQIKDRHYHQKYQKLGNMIHLVAIGFSKTERNVTSFVYETLPGE